MDKMQFDGVSLADDDLRERSSCPVCQGTAFRFLTTAPFNRRALRYDLCADCGSAVMNPAPSQDWYNAFYAGHFWEHKARKDKTTAETYGRMWRKALARGRKLTGFLNQAGFAPASDGRVLEIGCGYGIVGGTVARQIGAASLGVEPSIAASAMARAYFGTEIVAAHMDELAERQDLEPFDLIIFSYVLENIVDPDKAMATARTLLRPGGAVLIDTANLSVAPGLGIYHPAAFSRLGLERLLTRHGLRPRAQVKTGAPSSCLRRLYLTVLADLGDDASSAKTARPASVAGVKLAWFGPRLQRLPPLKRLDGWLSRRAFRLSDDDERYLDGVMKAVDGKQTATPD